MGIGGVSAKQRDAGTGILEVVELLMSAGLDPSVKAKDGTTAADAARALGLNRVAQRIAWYHSAKSS